MIQYIENTNLAYCDGYKFRKDKKTGYWLCTTLGKRLHTYIYEKYKGEIPRGMQVHHIDHNKDNNDISNLKLLTKKEHIELHKKEMTEEQKQKLRDNLNKNARPKAIEWHKSVEGKEWHKKIYEKNKDLFHRKYNKICQICGSKYITTQKDSKFCCNKCKSKYRRINNLDITTKECLICGKTFQTNKYRPASTCSRECAGLLRRKDNDYVK